ncbi:hypothetical protein MP228_010250 [Amoeboaphelidium protococcarum]|nr:hypothetical protein MP228_010250 [Amoeboaphelidium protococcarum]
MFKLLPQQSLSRSNSQMGYNTLKHGNTLRKQDNISKSMKHAEIVANCVNKLAANVKIDKFRDELETMVNNEYMLLVQSLHEVQDGITEQSVKDGLDEYLLEFEPRIKMHLEAFINYSHGDEQAMMPDVFSSLALKVVSSITELKRFLIEEVRGKLAAGSLSDLAQSGSNRFSILSSDSNGGIGSSVSVGIPEGSNSRLDSAQSSSADSVVDSYMDLTAVLASKNNPQDKPMKDLSDTRSIMTRAGNADGVLEAKLTREPTPQIKAPPPTSSQEQRPVNSVLQKSAQIFLLDGNQTKKVLLDAQLELSLTKLQMLFVEQFGYKKLDEGSYLSIYVYDKKYQIWYELTEDMLANEPNVLSDGAMLRLNSDSSAMSEVKKALDHSLNAFGQELKEVMSAVKDFKVTFESHQQQQQQVHAAQIAAAQIQNQQQQQQQQQKQQPQKRLSVPQVIPPSSAQQQPAQNDVSKRSSTSNGSQAKVDGDRQVGARVVSNLQSRLSQLKSIKAEVFIQKQTFKEQYTQVQQDFVKLQGVMMSVNKTILTDNVIDHQSKRSMIEQGKVVLEKEVDQLNDDLNDLYDEVEEMRKDILNRQRIPSKVTLETFHATLSKLNGEMKRIFQYLGNVKPVWKSTWEDELKQVVNEQGFLKKVEEKALRIEEDLSAIEPVLQHAQKIVELKETSDVTSSKRFVMPDVDDMHSGIMSVMIELSAVEIDSVKRLKAIELNEKMRKKELTAKQSEDPSEAFKRELDGFVGERKLKKTGGIELLELERQKREAAALRGQL